MICAAWEVNRTRRTGCKLQPSAGGGLISRRRRARGRAAISGAHWNLVTLGVHALHVRLIVAPLHLVIRYARSVAACRATEEQTGSGADRCTRARATGHRPDSRAGSGADQGASHRVGCRGVRSRLPGVARNLLRVLVAGATVGL